MDATLELEIESIVKDVHVPREQVERTLELLDAGNTIPFITRYRKDETGGLDEQKLREIRMRATQVRALQDRKSTILKSIEAQGKLTDELRDRIVHARTSKALEDHYLPFKPKKQTLATQARQRGLTPLARDVMDGIGSPVDLATRAQEFVRVDKGLAHVDDVMTGVRHLVAEELSERADLRRKLRGYVWKHGSLVSSGVESSSAARDGAPSSGRAVVHEQQDAKHGSSDADAKQPAPAAISDSGRTDAIDSGGAVEGNIVESNIVEGNTVEASAVEACDVEACDVEASAVAAHDVWTARDEVAGNTEVTSANPPANDEGSETEANTSNADDPSTTTESTTKHALSSASPTHSDDHPPEGVLSPAPETTPDQPSAQSPHVATTVDTAGETSIDEDAARATEATSTIAQPEAATNASDEASKESSANKATEPRSSKPAKGKAKKTKAKKPKRDPFESYRDFREAITKVPPHRILAINRGERARALRVRIEVDFDPVFELAQSMLVPDDHPHRELLMTCVRDALQRLVVPALEREIRRELTEKAEEHAVEVFARNLRHLLLQRPVRGLRVLAIDPGFKSGCKIACLDEFGNVLDHDLFFIVGNDERIEQSRQKLIAKIREHQIKVIAIGNGTACRQSERLVAELLENQLKENGVSYVIVNEAGASVYSTSTVGREELPQEDPTIRSAVSIGRRLLDPLSELVKISAANIGVGLYQHDVKAKHLQESLDDVVASCVNFVGVDVNTASPSLLRYVSGLNQLTARRIVEYRAQHGPLTNRNQLKEVQGIGDTTFIQAAGFLRVTGGDEPLDSTWIHPESYSLARDVLKRMGVSGEEELKQAVESTSTVSDQVPAPVNRVADVSLDIQVVADELDAGVMRLADIVHDLKQPGRDPREDLPAPVFRRGIVKFEDLEAGMELNGRVLNVVDFGVFVDIGVGDSGLIHISKLSDRYVSDPHDVASVGDLIHVWVMDVDKKRRRVSLSAIPDDRRDSMRRPGVSRRGPQTSGPNRARRKPPIKGAGKEIARGGGKRVRPSRPKPARPPKPVKPITKAMVEGRKPMRSFSDLKQFFDIKDNPEAPPQDQ